MPCAETEAAVRLRLTALKGALRCGALPAAPKEAPSAAPLSGVARATHTLRQCKLAQGERSAPCLASARHHCFELLPQQHMAAVRVVHFSSILLRRRLMLLGWRIMCELWL